MNMDNAMEPSAAVLEHVIRAIRNRLEHGNPSAIVRHELESILRVARDEAAARGVELPQ